MASDTCDVAVGFGVGLFKHERRSVSAQQRTRLVAQRWRRSEIEPAKVTERKVAAIEHCFSVALPPLEMSNAFERVAHAGLVRRCQKRNPIPEWRIQRQFREVSSVFFAPDREFFVLSVTCLQHWQNGNAQEKNCAPDDAARIDYRYTDMR